MPRLYRRHSEENLKLLCSNSFSYSEVLRKLGLKVCGGNYKHLQRNIDKFGIDISHMKHQAFNQGREFKLFDTLLKTSSIRKRLLKEDGCCSMCGLFMWNDRPLLLELDHIDGDNRNNQRDNLRLLCPNCHSQTSTFRNRKRE